MRFAFILCPNFPKIFSVKTLKTLYLIYKYTRIKNNSPFKLSPLRMLILQVKKKITTTKQVSKCFVTRSKAIHESCECIKLKTKRVFERKVKKERKRKIRKERKESTQYK